MVPVLSEEAIESTPRRLGVWVYVFGATLALQVAAGLVTDTSRTSSTESLVGMHPCSQVLLYEGLRCTFAPWCTAAFVARLIDHRGRFLHGSKIHRWTWRYALVSFASSIIGPATVISSCGAFAVLRTIFTWVAIATAFCTLVPMWFLCFINLLKLRTLADDVPHWASTGRRCFYALVILSPVVLVLWIASLLARCLREASVICSLVRWSLVASGIAALVSLIVFFACVVGALCLVANAASMAEKTDVVDAEVELLQKAAAWTRLAALATACSATTTLAYCCVIVAVGALEHPVLWIATSNTLDIVVNTLAAGMLAGFWGPTAPAESEERLMVAAERAADSRARLIQDKLLSAVSKRTGNAATIAALLGNNDPATLVAEAVLRFRCISWSVLSAMPELILGSGPLDGARASLRLYELSEPCQLTKCDVFLSHSWHDSRTQKWAALTRWCLAFQTSNRRPPQLWFAKVCINQSHISADLECLPIFLAGCNGMLVISGDTYTCRLWCVMELFVYVSMREDGEQDLPDVIFLGETDAESGEVRKTWASFDALNCQYVNSEDKTRIMAAIEASDGGISGFNRSVTAIAAATLGSTDGIGVTAEITF